MAQGALPFKYEEDGSRSGMTALGGLPAYLDLAHVMRLSRLVNKHVGVRCGAQGWTDAEVITSLILLNLAGGDSVEDLRVLEADEGLCRLIGRCAIHGVKPKMRRHLQNRWRKAKERSVPSASAVFRYLSAFHNGDQEKMRRPGKAYIPTANKHLKGLVKVNREVVSFFEKNTQEPTATLDMDATIVETHKSEALFCYQGYRSYQPLNTWWAEQGMVVHTEFRDGNVPAGHEQLRVFKEALGCLPRGITTVRLRSDTAGYQHDLLRYCETGKNKRFGRIEFTIGCDVSRQFKQAVEQVPESHWKPLIKTIRGRKIDTGRQWAEVCFVPNAIGRSKKDPEYRYLALREVLNDQRNLPGMQDERDYGIPTMSMKDVRYKVFGIVTNMDWDGQSLISWHHERCGKSEEAHGIMKEDLAGGKLPSKYFGQNAAWWWIMILAFNLNAAMKTLALGEHWVSKRMKAIRFHLINIPARVLERSRYLLVRLSKGHPALKLLLSARRRIAMLSPAPT